MRREKLGISLALLIAVLCLYYREMLPLIPAILLPVLAHEAGHLLTLRLLGLSIESIQPELRGVSIRYSGPCTEAGHIAAALAGPLGGLAYAGALLLLNGKHLPWLQTSAEISLLLTAFNLLPILPLDGGQIFIRLCRSTLGIGAGERLYVAVSNALLALALLAGVLLAWFRQASAPLAAAIWLLLFQNDRQALVKNGEVL